MKLKDKEFDEKAEAQVKASLKSEEEIKKYTLDDKLPLSKNLLLLLNTGTHEQKLALFRNLPMYWDDQGVVAAIIPVLYVSLL